MSLALLIHSDVLEFKRHMQLCSRRVLLDKNRSKFSPTTKTLKTDYLQGCIGIYSPFVTCNKKESSFSFLVPLCLLILCNF